MIDVEIKARCNNHDFVRKKLLSLGAEFKGIDEQIDVYFHSRNGRLKLRKGKIEGALVHYLREDVKDIKPSEFMLYKSHNLDNLEEILTRSLGVKVIVKKKREIYFIENVKFNIDIVDGLGRFVEIEAMTNDPNDVNKLRLVVNDYLDLLNISKDSLESLSYSDLLLKK